VTGTSPSEFALRSIVGAGLRFGSLTFVGRDGSEHRIEGAQPGPSGVIVLKSPNAARRTLAGTALGMAEAYMAGEWDTPDLDSVLAVGLANLKPRLKSTPNAFAPLARAWHSLRDNSVGGSRRNIAYHYDLGNDFYRLWLDETMAYSSALYVDPPTYELSQPGPVSAPLPEEPLPSAQVRKWDRMLDLLQPSSRDHILEIGCGWGGFALHAAEKSGCKVTGVTLSEEQHAFATQQVVEAGLEDRIDIRLQDYRHVPGAFDAIASIEMFEAVGERWWPAFFSRIRELLSPGGAAAIQVITIDDARFDDYRRNPDFIQRYVFPGGMLPSPERFAESAASEGLSADAPHFFGTSYAATIAEWSARFESALPEVLELGFDERFVRMWRYYLAYCRAGFTAGTVDVMQVRLNG
jgi:cyclopropane-fatty-acyl-phospholipid synthase